MEAKDYYKKSSIADFIVDYVYNREVAMFNKEGNIITQRPYAIYNNGDILYLVDKGGYSIHATVEIWKDPMLLRDVNQREYYKIVSTYDIVVDFDVDIYKSMDRNLNIAKLLVYEVLERLEEFGYIPIIKYSGNRGFHLIFPLKGLVKIMDIDLLKYKEIVYRSFLDFMHVIVESAASHLASKIGKNNIADIVSNIVDYHLASWRHMIRVPYSLHEKTGLVSIVLYKDDILKFTKEMAKPENVIEPIYPETGDLSDLILLSLSYSLTHEISSTIKPKHIKIDIKEVPELPPCVRTLLEGVPVGIRNNTMFFLLNFFKSLGYDKEKVKEILFNWNEKNSEPLRDREIEYSIEYHFNKNYLPYSCSKLREYIGRQYCQPNEICNHIKNPIQYVRFVNMLKKKKIESKQENNNNVQK